ncbi:MAG: formylmethanofuran dehydrogenase subunit B [Candidatus Altiarchaeota archaeon]
MIHREITCPVCGCGCDDITVAVEKGQITDVRGACLVGRSKFMEVSGGQKHRIMKPFEREGGKIKEISWDRAIGKAADILSSAERPLIYGFSENSCEAMKVGVDMAEKIGGFIDSQSSHCHGPSILGEQMVGIPSCTLGMVANYADLVVYWGANPVDSHPRHLSRFSVYPKGLYRPEGRRDRKLIVVDTRKTCTAKIANQFIQVASNGDFELISALRIIVNGGDIEQAEVAGVPKKQIIKLAEDLTTCEYGVVFVGLGLTHSQGKWNNIDNLFHLVRAVNKKTRLSVIPMRGHYNVAGFNEVLTWRTGYPFSVDFQRGYPRYNPGENSIIDMLARGEIDAMLSISSDPGAHFPRKCVEHMAKIPLITIEVAHTPTTQLASLIIPGVVSGMESEATYYRMDNVPLTAKKFLDSPFNETKSDEHTLKQILEKLK